MGLAEDLRSQTPHHTSLYCEPPCLSERTGRNFTVTFFRSSLYDVHKQSLVVILIKQPHCKQFFINKTEKGKSSNPGLIYV